ncbi:MAG: hypothetical protein GX277_04210 [Bacteroidales bacterium]|nr:hypothetical protein [Bacteroidales bacterium]
MLNETHFAKGYSLHYAMNLLKRKLNEYEQPTPPYLTENTTNEQQIKKSKMNIGNNKSKTFIPMYLKATNNILQSFGFNVEPQTEDISIITKTNEFLQALREIYLSENKEKDNFIKMIFDVVSDAHHQINQDNFKNGYTDVWRNITYSLDTAYNYISELHFKETNKYFPFDISENEYKSINFDKMNSQLSLFPIHEFETLINKYPNLKLNKNFTEHYNIIKDQNEQQNKLIQVYAEQTVKLYEYFIILFDMAYTNSLNQKRFLTNEIKSIESILNLGTCEIKPLYKNYDLINIDYCEIQECYNTILLTGREIEKLLLYCGNNDLKALDILEITKCLSMYYDFLTSNLQTETPPTIAENKQTIMEQEHDTYEIDFETIADKILSLYELGVIDKLQEHHSFLTSMHKLAEYLAPITGIGKKSIYPVLNALLQEKRDSKNYPKTDKRLKKIHDKLINFGINREKLKSTTPIDTTD